MKKKVFAALLCLTLSLSACGQQSVETPAPTPTAEETATPTPTPTPTPEPTPTPVPAPTPEPSPEEVTELWGFPIDDTHDAFEVPAGGKLGTLLVTVEMVEGEYEFMNPATLSVWNPNDLSAPIQVIEESGFTHYYELLDANFDGYMDFCYTWSLSATNANYSLLVWDESEKKFADNEEFLGYGLVLDAENKTISNYTHGSAATGIHTIYCWENKKLLEARTVEVSFPSGIFDEQMELIVCDRIDGEMTEVYRETFVMDGETVYQEATKWYDLSYHGE